MSDSICCPKCGMLKTSCICSNSSKSRGKSRYQNKKGKKVSKKRNRKVSAISTGKTSFNNLNNKKVSTISTEIMSFNNLNNQSGSSNSNYKRGSSNSNNKGISNNSENNNVPNIETISKETRIANLKKEYPDIARGIIKNFPFDKPREGQFEVISEISKAIDDGYKYIVLEAGTGTGKSVIAATLAKMYSPAFILTMTKQLQDQYLKDFEKEGFTLVKGRNNFFCKEKEIYSGEDIRCNHGTCKERFAFRCKHKFISLEYDADTTLERAFRNNYWKSDIHCNYLEQKVDGINADVVIANYDYGMLELNYVHDFIKRKLLILDEAHNLENKIMSFIELEIDRNQLESEVKIKVTNEEIENLHKIGHSAWISFINNIIKRYEKESKKQKVKLETASKSKKPDFEKTVKDLADELDDYERFISYMEEDAGNWILEDNDEFIYFKPLKIDKYAKDYLFRFGEICLFMSATILDYKNFAKWLGLEVKDVKFIEVETPFELSKRPIDVSRSVDMKYQSLKRNAPKTIDFISEILDKHKNDKGLIHTVSYQCRDYLMKNINNPNRLISHSSNNRMKVLKEFEKSDEPLVLLSPSMNEGVDLPYDKCRFQIIYKMPFPPIKDKQVALRNSKDKHWYPYQTMMNLVQTYGRGMRAEDDYCQTYVIDNRLKGFVHNRPLFRRLVPKFFKEAIVDAED